MRLPKTPVRALVIPGALLLSASAIRASREPPPCRIFQATSRMPWNLAVYINGPPGFPNMLT